MRRRPHATLREVLPIPSDLPSTSTAPVFHTLASSDDMDQVTDYLKKKGFTKTEAIFRQETSNLGPDGRPIVNEAEDGPKKYARAFILLRDYVDNALDLYKVNRTLVLISCRENKLVPNPVFLV